MPETPIGVEVLAIQLVRHPRPRVGFDVFLFFIYSLALIFFYQVLDVPAYR
jgi:hypothetical protein